MGKEYVMGNGAIALGAIAAGVNLVAGYPGTPSSEIIETIEKYNDGQIHLEWSVNEKAALEVAAAAAYSGARTLVTMKQMGLNVAADPLMSLAYVGVKGGMVVVSADDPGPISSQTEQDTRRFAGFARIPVFDPVSPEDAYNMIQEAFDYSEKYQTPVLFRPTTRVCHAYSAIEASSVVMPKLYEGFVKDSSKWVIFPKLSYKNHGMMEKRNIEIGKDFSGYRANCCEGDGDRAVFAGGISYAYAKDYLKGKNNVKLCRIGTAYPFPEDFALECLKGVKEVIVVEELSPLIEEELLKLAGKHKLDIQIRGKLTGDGILAGEYSAETVALYVGRFLKEENEFHGIDTSGAPALPVRPPVLCAGCPHRASFYAVKTAMKGKKAYFCGDIGCYTLGNAMPLDMVDTCLCMGAGITMAQGLHWVDKDACCFAFVGDSTFFASGMTGVANAIYNEADMILCVLDNSTTAMTGHQPHPGTGRNMMGNVVDKIDIKKILEGMGVTAVETVNPFDFDETVQMVVNMSNLPGVKAIIMKAPCIAIEKPEKCLHVGDTCIKCKKCIKEIGCPAITYEDGKIKIDENLCSGCGLCTNVCPVNAISDKVEESTATNSLKNHVSRRGGFFQVNCLGEEEKKANGGKDNE